MYIQTYMVYTFGDAFLSMTRWNLRLLYS